MSRHNLTGKEDQFSGRPVDELVRIVVESIDREWSTCGPVLESLHCRLDSREALEAGIRLCRGRTVRERRAGAAILQGNDGDTAYYEERLNTVLRLLQDKRPTVLHWAAWSLGMMGDDRVVEPLTRLKDHPSVFVRRGVAEALAMGFEDDVVADAFIALSSDPDDEVRQSATLSLGNQNFRDRVEIREALLARTEDPDPVVRKYALTGLEDWRTER